MRNIDAKICVYAICKNESKFIDRWVESLQNEADCVVVLDTGSTDDSVEKLSKYEPFVHVQQYDYFSEVGYFRFDKARNDSLKLVPFDAEICVVLDLDQVPVKGWSQVIRERWVEGYDEICGDIVDHNQNGEELNRWRSRNVHPNSPFYVWDRIIHEGINYYGKGESKAFYDERFIINHYPDEAKGTRTLYKTLLEYACKEYPKDAYYGIYLGIELSRRYDVHDAISAFERCIHECDFSKDHQIHYQCYLNIATLTDDYPYAIGCLRTAEGLGNGYGIHTRRIYKIFADIYEKMEKYDDAIEYLEKALSEVPLNSNDWTDDASYFDGYIEDRLSLFYYYQKHNYEKAIDYCNKALAFHPESERLMSNLKFYYEKLNEARRESNGQ